MTALPLLQGLVQTTRMVWPDQCDATVLLVSDPLCLSSWLHSSVAVFSKRAFCYRSNSTPLGNWLGVYQLLSKRTIFFVTDQTPRPYPTRSFPTQFQHQWPEWSTVWVSTKPLLTEEIWPGRGLNLGLPNEKPALYPLLHELHKTRFERVCQIQGDQMSL
jgi:hypothetical protein